MVSAVNYVCKELHLDVWQGFEYAFLPPQDHSDILGGKLHQVLSFIVVVSSWGYRNV